MTDEEFTEVRARLERLEQCFAVVATAILLMDAVKDLERYGVKTSLKYLESGDIPQAIEAAKDGGCI